MRVGIKLHVLIPRDSPKLVFFSKKVCEIDASVLHFMSAPKRGCHNKADSGLSVVLHIISDVVLGNPKMSIFGAAFNFLIRLLKK